MRQHNLDFELIDFSMADYGLYIIDQFNYIDYFGKNNEIIPD